VALTAVNLTPKPSRTSIHPSPRSLGFLMSLAKCELSLGHWQVIRARPDSDLGDLDRKRRAIPPDLRSCRNKRSTTSPTTRRLSSTSTSIWQNTTSSKLPRSLHPGRSGSV